MVESIFPILQCFSSTSKIARIIFQGTICSICCLQMFAIWTGPFFSPQFAKQLTQVWAGIMKKVGVRQKKGRKE